MAKTLAHHHKVKGSNLVYQVLKVKTEDLTRIVFSPKNNVDKSNFDEFSFDESTRRQHCKTFLLRQLPCGKNKLERWLLEFFLAKYIERESCVIHNTSFQLSLPMGPISYSVGPWKLYSLVLCNTLAYWAYWYKL